MPTVACPFCSNTINLPDPWNAPEYTCPHCHKVVGLPAASAAPVAPEPEPVSLEEGDYSANPREDMAGVRRDLRRRNFLLRTVKIRQAARWSFDLVRFGDGPVERLCAALILAAFFVIGTLVVSLVAKLGTDYGLTLAGIALGSVIATSAVLVLWTIDDERLAEKGKQLEAELLPLRERELMLKEVLQEEEARQREEAELEAAARDEGDARGEERRREVARRRPRRPRTQRCPYCQETVSIHALKCRYCGEYLDEELARQRQPRKASAGAAVLSLLIPGAGQISNGRTLAGLGWLFLVPGAYVMTFVATFCCCGLPGLVVGLVCAVGLHVICVFDAAAGV